MPSRSSRQVSVRSLLALLLHRKYQLQNLPRAIDGIERRLRQRCVKGSLSTDVDIWAVMDKYPLKRPARCSSRKLPLAQI